MKISKLKDYVCMRNDIISVFSPGRINIIGEHTDHQGGYVLPACITHGITLYGAINNKNHNIVYTNNFDKRDRFNSFKFELGEGWQKYVRGSIRRFKEITAQEVSVNIWIDSNIPEGGGLSSSAALEIGILYLLNQLYQTNISDKKMIAMAHYVENEYVGVQCGIMDQTIIQLGKANNALKLHCGTLNHSYISLDNHIRFLLIDTDVQRKLSDSKYNKRIEELNSALIKIRNIPNFKDLAFLSDLSSGELHKLASVLTQTEFKRTKHVVTESERVPKYIELSKEKRIEEAGQLLFESHESLQNDFECSWDMADKLMSYMRTNPIIHGARMLGGGWGGSLIVQIFKHDITSFEKDFDKWCMDEFQYTLNTFPVKIGDGVRILEGNTMGSEILEFFS